MIGQGVMPRKAYNCWIFIPRTPENAVSLFLSFLTTKSTTLPLARFLLPKESGAISPVFFKKFFKNISISDYERPATGLKLFHHF
jgi:hypothetical protein